MRLEYTLPWQFADLASKAPYKCYYGGRGAKKSYTFADWSIVRALRSKILILCGREYMNSIADSVHSLIEIRIKALGVDSEFDIKNTEIICKRTGSQYIFKGLSQNITSLKSIPNIGILWIEEGENLSQRTIDIIDPTVREENSEIWINFNPCRDDDPMYKWMITNPPQKAIVKKVFYYHNKDLPNALREKAEQMKVNDYKKYQHIWLGEPIIDYDTLVYRWDVKNESEKPIPFYPSHPVYTSWDFGTRDETAVIAWQVIKGDQFPNGCIIQIFDEIVNKNKPAQWYRDEVNKRSWSRHTHGYYCDPSGANRESDLTGWCDKIGFPFTYDHNYSIAEIIDHANDYMPSVRINRNQCPRMFQAFRCWQYPVDKNGVVKKGMKPEHSEHSHPGTAWYYGIWNHFQRPHEKTKVRRI